MKTILFFLLTFATIVTFAYGETGVVPKDLNGVPLPGGAISGIFSVTPGTKGTASVTATGKTGLYFSCTQASTSGTAATVKVGRNGVVTAGNYYHAASGTVWLGAKTGTTSVTFASYSTANSNNCAGYYW